MKTEDRSKLLKKGRGDAKVLRGGANSEASLRLIWGHLPLENKGALQNRDFDLVYMV